jgi:acyl carrier protein
VGELWIGGAGVARGYRRRSALTAERFVPDPFVADPAARLYRTGDRARYRHDGAIEVLGRTDQQVKLRGFRIELAEVEAALRAHAAVGEAVALVREDRPGDRRLVAYLTASDGPPPNLGELRRALRRQLPDYMVPSALIVLPALPRTLNGKIDRRALPAPADDRAPSAPAPSPPVTLTERALAAIWSDVLGVAQIGTLESFFDLGGHSLQAMEVLAAIEVQLGVRPAPALLRIQTLGQLAASCDELLAQGTRREPPPAPPPAPSLGGRMLGALRRIASAEPTGGRR